jgi:nucleotide-binding universal stress UspA family protein
MLGNNRTPSITFEKILLATDFSHASESAFEKAVNLCRTFSASLFILHIFEYADEVSPQMPRMTAEVGKIYEDTKLSFDRLLQSARDRGVVCDGSIGAGLAAHSILETIDALGIKLVVLGTHANRGLERLIFGSTAEAVLRKAPCPVVTVGPQVRNHNKAAADGPVIFATDFHASTIHAVRFAGSVCGMTGSPLHCLTVLPMTMEGGVRNMVIPELMNQALHHVAQESGKGIAAPLCTTVFGTDVAASVAHYAKTQNASMIVLGVHTAPPMASHGPCNATSRLIANSPCPVLTVNTCAQKHAKTLTDDNTEPEAVNHNLRASWLRGRTRVA